MRTTNKLVQHSLEEAMSAACEFQSRKTARKIVEIVGILVECFRKGGKVLICGNGGSCADAGHFASELTGSYSGQDRVLPVIAINDPQHLTCVGNDFGNDYVFQRYVKALGKPEDVLVVISTSGNSENVVEAVRQAHTQYVRTIALLGRDGGAMKDMCDLELIVPFDSTARIQECHMVALHTIAEAVINEMEKPND